MFAEAFAALGNDSDVRHQLDELPVEVRREGLADSVTDTEMGYDIVAENWLGVSTPTGVPAQVREKLDAALQEAMMSDDVVAQFDTWGLVREPMTSAEFSEFVAAQFAAWKRLVAAAMD